MIGAVGAVPSARRADGRRHLDGRTESRVARGVEIQPRVSALRCGTGIAEKEGADPRSKDSEVPRFSDTSEIVIDLHRATWKDAGRSAKIWRSSLCSYAFPRLGPKPVSEITSADVLGVLMPIWNEKTETARRVKHRIGAVMRWAIAQGFRNDNPAGDAITEALPRGNPAQKHQRALHHSAAKGAIERVRGTDAWLASKLCFEFLVLTATRSGEVRGARWDEVDLGRRVWIVPAERMKASVEHRVPLGDRAVEILREAKDVMDGTGLVFPSVTGKTLSDSTLSKLLRELGVEAVPHGFRSSFRDWCADIGQPREVAEATLAHTVKGVEGAYFRSDLFELRRRVMEAWGEYID